MFLEIDLSLYLTISYSKDPIYDSGKHFEKMSHIA